LSRFKTGAIGEVDCPEVEQGVPYRVVGLLTGSGDDIRAPISIGDDPAILKGTRMAWVILIVAGLFEVGWAIGMKYTEGFTRLWPTMWTVPAMVLSLWLLGIAMKSLPVSTAYSVWVGVGSVGTVILGNVLLGEPVNAARLISVGLILAGILGLKLATPA